MNYHKTLKSLPAGCYFECMNTNNLAWLTRFDYETFEVPVLTEIELTELKTVWSEYLKEMPSTSINTEKLDMIEKITILNFDCLKYAQYKDNEQSKLRSEYFDKYNKLQKAIFEFDKLKSDQSETQNIDYNQLSIFIESVLKLSYSIDPFKISAYKFILLYNQAQTVNNKQIEEYEKTKLNK